MSRPLTKRQRGMLSVLVTAARGYQEADKAARDHGRTWPGWSDEAKRLAWNEESLALCSARRNAEVALTKTAARALPADVLERIS